jgi:hypothetical protein
MRKIQDLIRSTGSRGATWAGLGLAVLILAAGCSRNESRPTAVDPPSAGVGSVQGVVLANGAPLSTGALLRLDPAAGAARLSVAREDGSFAFPLVPGGDCTVTLDPPAGYRPVAGGEATVRLGVRAGEVSDVRFELVPRVDVPGDSMGGGSGTLGRIRVSAELDGAPLVGLSVAAVSESADRFGGTTGWDGAVGYYLPLGTYTVEATPVLFGEAAPWLRVESIVPPVVTLEPLPAEATSTVHVAYNPDVPVPPGELVAWVGTVVDSTNGEPPPPATPVQVEVTVLRSGSDEVVGRETTADSQAKFPLGPGAYDVVIAVPAGFRLVPGGENPVRSVPVSPRQSSWVSFVLLPLP